MLSAADEEAVFLRLVSTYANALFYVVSHLLLDSYTINTIHSRVKLTSNGYTNFKSGNWCKYYHTRGNLDIEVFNYMICPSVFDCFINGPKLLNFKKTCSQTDIVYILIFSLSRQAVHKVSGS